MDHKTVEEYVLSMPNAKLDYPFGEDVAVYKVFTPETSGGQADGVQGSKEKRANRTGKQGSAVRGDWKMFALIAEKSDPVRISLKCDPKLSELLREKYETVMPGYHLNKKHWNTLVLSGQLPWEDIKGLIRHSYERVVKKDGSTSG